MRFFVGLLVTMMLYTAVGIYLPHSREQWFAREIKAVGGTVEFEDVTPPWNPTIVSNYLGVWSRFAELELEYCEIPESLLKRLKALTRLTWLELDGARIVYHSFLCEHPL